MKNSDNARCIRKYIKKGGTVSFHAEVRRKNAKPIRKSFRTLTEAKNWVRSSESSVLEGRAPPESKARRYTLSHLIDQYIRLHLHRFPHRLEDQTHHLKWWQLHFGDRLLVDITPSLLAEAKNMLLTEPTVQNKKRTGSTVNRYLSSLSKAFSLAAREWEWITDNPFQKVSKLKENPGRTRFLTREELHSLLYHCKESPNPNLYPIVLTAASTAMRFGEIIELRWRHVDLKKQLITIEISKNGDRRVVPISNQLRAVIEMLNVSKNSEDYLFPSKNPLKRHPGSMIRKAFLKALENAGISGFKFHDLRHTCASHLAMNGATQGELMEILGHRSPTMTKKYTHFSKEHIARLLQKTNNNLIGQQGENP